MKQMTPCLIPLVLYCSLAGSHSAHSGHVRTRLTVHPGPR